MKIALLADIHGCLPALEGVMAQLERLKPDHIVLLGDLLNHGPRNAVPQGYQPAAVATRLNEYAELMMAVRGNCDSEVDQMLLSFPCTAPYSQMLVDGRRWFVTHGHLYRPDEVPMPAGSVYVSGHTHVPVLESGESKVLLNPGSITFPRGAWPASFGWYEEGKIQIRNAASDGILAELALV
ncbi:phosphodiesterase YfcE [Aeromonas diversa CDC 2478-85]|uniref:Phosphoesterase n=1 Tax=Aeromonas diversa CDC 2478-85 TaxID=1268237 RepID=N9V9H8_9GAMM|nr:phosphodiesterase [Aeromonas diversa]ENY71942.1 phosphodiesterase YfcE [Aeromonas diversa CDC 2478-85]